MRDAKLHLKVYKADTGLLKVVKYRRVLLGSAVDEDAAIYWQRDGFKPHRKHLNWGRSSVGRAPALQAGGREFESLRFH